jgi:predicted nucleic acid-binding protein
VRFVVDASVIVKRILPDSMREGQTGDAIALLRAIRAGRVEAIQPPHWLAEVAAVLVRLRPEIAESALDLLDALELPVAADIAIYPHPLVPPRTGKNSLRTPARSRRARPKVATMVAPVGRSM